MKANEESRTVLFVDDHDVLYRSGTERVLTKFERHEANPLVPAREYPWEVAIGWTSIYRNPDTGKYQLWYQAGTGDRLSERTQDCAVCYAESDDGIHFTKPMLDLFSFEDHARTNIVLIGNGGYSYRYGNAVVVDPNPEDESKRYKMSYFDWAGKGGDEYPGLCVAFSPDGIVWTKHPEAPLSRMAYGKGGFGTAVRFEDDKSEPWLIPMSMSDAVDSMWDPVREVYAIYGKVWIDGPDGGQFWKHAMGRIESTDFINWSKPQLVLAPNDDDPGYVEFHTSPVFYHSGRYFALKQILDRGTGGGTINIELAISRDGIEWERPFQNDHVLARSEGNLFDSGSIFTNATPVVLEDEIRFYYGAYSGGATSVTERGHLSGVGMATIPRDRFAGIRPVAKSDQVTVTEPLEHLGQVTMKPIDLTGVKAITLNADASEGEIRVEVLNASGRRLRGYSAEVANPISGDGLRHPVAWKDLSPGDLEDGVYVLRLHLCRAAVFSITLR